MNGQVAGGRRHAVRRAQGLVALAASVAVVAIGVSVLLRPPSHTPTAASPGVASAPTASSSLSPAATAQPDAEPLLVSGSGVGTFRFGSDADEVRAAVTGRLGEPDRTVGPVRYSRIPGSDGWFEDADDPLSPGWGYPVTSQTCWRELCLVFGGAGADAVRLRGWALVQSGSGAVGGDVRLAGTGVRLGDTWERLHDAYPDVVVAGAEGASVAVRNTPWPGVSDGAAPWRLSGQWDYQHPHRAPAGAVVTRLSGGEGPEPGCC